jgi:tetratricopeptide (TPR) repeat protein
MAVDVNSLFARAEQSFAAGRLDSARADLLSVQRSAGEHAAVLHLLGLVEKKRGDRPAALRALEAASRLDPRNPQVANNLGNLLGEMGRAEEALASYDRAMTLQPGWPDPQLNRAITLHRLGRFSEARAALRTLQPIAARSPRYWNALATLERDAGRFPEAAAAFDRALALDANNAVARRGRARVALDRGEADAAERLRALLAQAPQDPELLLQLSEALELQGEPDAAAPLAEAVARAPDWIAGHDRLARMRGEAGDADPARSFREAIVARPRDPALRIAYIEALAADERFAEALAETEQAGLALGPLPPLLLLQASAADEAGETAQAARLFAGDHGADDPSWQRARARHALRVGDAARAASLLEPLAFGRAGEVRDWAHLLLAWRLTEDPRTAWLTGDPGYWGEITLPLDPAELAGLAESLRDLHRTRSHPIGQSLRGGTQTRGRLFARPLPALQQLRQQLEAAIADFVGRLPPADPSHPLLRHRADPLVIEGSWSVRLQASGFHVHHIHPRGILSSACYIALPDRLDEERREGWLELGAPPLELGLDLPPLAAIRPRPGHLALFPSYLFHGTRPFGAGERLTVAFDVVPAREAA